MSKTTRISISELQALLLKAAIGTGFPHGHAQALSEAAADIAQDPIALREAVACLDAGPKSLDNLEDETGLEVSAVSPVLAAPVAVDALQAGYSEIRLKALRCPQLMAAMLRAATRAYAIGFVLERAASGHVLRLTGSASPSPSDVPQQAAEEINALKTLAALTFVPESAASRSKGAGAGLQDND